MTCDEIQECKDGMGQEFICTRMINKPFLGMTYDNDMSRT